MSESQTLLQMAKDLVLAQIKANRLSPEEMHPALHNTYALLHALDTKEATHGSDILATLQRPALNWKRSITKNFVTCLLCGARFKQLTVRHLREHGLDARSYRFRFGIPRNQALSAGYISVLHKQIMQQARTWERAPMFLKKQERAQQRAAAKIRRGKAHESETTRDGGTPKRASRKKPT
jgi:predicted transcriptional regulator